ncbi:nuclear migration and anchoring protein unc-84-like isoform X2 [Coccinella septempunctata]|uniref:nuclear migration and anchoring protein unc-84-like isoform X2 n=1 Tax=Coccinella septempunctata TaxID=41139 RepID=UPI001D07F738|nr:nuclear migration and anchoring protein unc-84-like isoform X2 [Coccinella septempunctata]
MSSHSLSNEKSKVGEPFSHNYNTRLSVRRSMSAFSGREAASNSSENIRPKPATENKESLLSIYRRNSASSVGEVEGEAPSSSKKNSRTKFSIFRRLSSVSSVAEREEANSVQRRSSLLLDHDGCEGGGACQLMNCESYSRMDPCYAETSNKQTKICGFLPCLLALGAIIIIFIPLAKILGGLRSDLCTIHHEMTDIKKHVGIDTTEDSDKSAQLPREYSSAIKGLVKDELENFDSDKTGKTDFALETAGGRIVKVIDTENYGSTVGLFGLTLCEGNNGPRAMIQSSSAPGECWAFKGSKGTVLIKLLGKVRINAVSLEHISSKISPTGKLDTAPKDFAIYGLEDLKKTKVLLGRFQYKLDSHPIQTFPIKMSCQVPFEFVEFHVDSNHGSTEYTCIYRLRVHGTLESL